MAKKSAKKKQSSGKPKELPPLTLLGRQIMSHILTNIALGNYDECCSLEDLAAHFGRTPGRFRAMIRKVVEQGYVTVSQGVLETVYPTVEAIRQQDPHLSESQAKAILRKIGG